MRSGSNTRAAPMRWNSLIASGAVMSLATRKSGRTMMNSPGLTSSRPAWAARIFCVMV